MHEFEEISPVDKSGRLQTRLWGNNTSVVGPLSAEPHL